MHGRHYHVDGLTLLPRPVQQPRVPLWVVAAWPRPLPAPELDQVEAAVATLRAAEPALRAGDRPAIAAARPSIRAAQQTIRATLQQLHRRLAAQRG